MLHGAERDVAGSWVRVRVRVRARVRVRIFRITLDLFGSGTISVLARGVIPCPCNIISLNFSYLGIARSLVCMSATLSSVLIYLSTMFLRWVCSCR